MEKAEYIWHSGKFVPWDEAQVHVLSHGLHYGTGVFEGVRCYDGEQGPAIFRHREHLERLIESARMYFLELPFSAEEKVTFLFSARLLSLGVGGFCDSH